MRSGCISLLQVVVLLAVSMTVRADVAVTLDPDVRYQTIMGWGASSWLPPKITPALRAELIETAVNEFGLTRLRLEPPGGNAAHQRRWEWDNDNADPYDTDWSALNTAGMDERVTEMVAPFKQRVEANGERFTMYLSPSFFNGGSTGEIPAWLFHHPAEYAEFATSMLLYLKQTHGLEVDYYCILNEPGNNNAFWENQVAGMIRVLGPWLSALGLDTKIQFPEAISADTSWGFIRALQNDASIWPYVGLLSYHLYGSNDPARSKIRDFGLARDLSTAQTEYMNLSMDILHADLINGGVSVWEVYGITSQFELGLERLRRQSNYWKFRQVLRYVRPGAVRIAASSGDANLRVLAFRKDMSNTVVLINGAGARRALISSLPAGSYAVSYTVGVGPYQEFGVHSTDAGGVLAVDVPSEAVLTVQTYAGSNLPPVPTKWEATPEFLTQPAASVTLLAAATDPELDTVTYAWSIKSQPAGANATLSSADTASTTANGLTVAGTYVFAVAIKDAGHTVTREVRVPVFATNQPPLPMDVHNRNPVLIMLPQNSTTLRAGGWDLEGYALSYAWEVLSQPAGADAALVTPNASSCVASNLTVAGDYVFRVAVSDAAHTVYETLTVPVHAVNTAPEITSLAANPPALLPGKEGVTHLSATLSDADGDDVSVWWSVVSSPAGTTPLIAAPGALLAEVTGLTLEGSYTFRLTAVDRAAVSTRDVSVVVRTIPGDMDLDLDVDQNDFGLFQVCYSGSGIPQDSASCRKARLDADSDVDLNDLERFIACMSGANQPAEVTCGD
ncbi:MAG: hypothetical protein AMXMBFR13_21370 [Phycisphaerae bacterium]